MRAALFTFALISVASPLQAQCHSDRELAPTQGTLLGRQADISGAWFVASAVAPDGTTGLVHLHRSQPNGSWEHSQTLAVTITGSFAPGVTLDGDRLFLTNSTSINRFQNLGGVWVTSGSPASVSFQVVFVDYAHPWLVVSNGNCGISFIYLNGVGRVFEVQSNGSLTNAGGFSGFPLDQQIGTSISITSNRLAVGAPGYDGFGKAASGNVVVFSLTRGSPLTFDSQLFDPFPVGSPTDFGQELSLSGDFLAVQAPEGAGRVELLRHQAGSWVPDGSILPPPGWFDFGDTLAMDGINLVVSARGLGGPFGIQDK
jgi:hypothetical protein